MEKEYKNTGNKNEGTGPARSVLKDVLLGPERGFKSKIEIPKPARSTEKKSEEFSVSRRELREELKKAYDPYNVVPMGERVGMEADIKSKRAQLITDKDAGKFLKELKNENKNTTKAPRFWGKFWENLKNKKK